MIASVLILVVSLVLLAYWFRYTCLLLLRGNPAAHAGAVAERNRLNFVNVQREVYQTGDLDALERALEKDYRLLCYLLEHSAGLDVSGIERHLLALDYRLMQVWYKLVRNSYSGAARKALLEMSGVLTSFAGKMGAHANDSLVA